MINGRKLKSVGIMICESHKEPPFVQHNFYAHLCRLGAQWGLLVFVFSPTKVDVKSATVQGYILVEDAPTASHWSLQALPLPDLIYDRSFFNTRRQYTEHHAAIRVLRKLKKIPYLGQSLKGKYAVQLVLEKDALVASKMPKTALFRHPSLLIRWLNQQGKVMLKPEFGSHGKGVLLVTKHTSSEYTIQGRNMRNQRFTEAFTDLFSLMQWLTSFIGMRSYLIQDYLPLQTRSGEVYDIRVLVQKGSKGDWELTGMAARLGQPESITANLHGGGKGAAVLALLEEQFNPDQAKSIIHQINTLCRYIPPLLEQHFGRLAELGIDIGIDQSGLIWVIEVNSKPGRAVARWFTHPLAHDHAMSNPMEYARFLLHQSVF
jgi:glutathione synthase/RimK-type ligase-like ATP-grasp enzyme